MANHVSAEEAALRQIEKLSAQVAQEVGPPSTAALRQIEKPPAQVAQEVGLPSPARAHRDKSRVGAAAVRRGAPRPRSSEGCWRDRCVVVAVAVVTVLLAAAAWFSSAHSLINDPIDAGAGTLMTAVCTCLGVYAGEWLTSCCRGATRKGRQCASPRARAPRSCTPLSEADKDQDVRRTRTARQAERALADVLAELRNANRRGVAAMKKKKAEKNLKKRDGTHGMGTERHRVRRRVHRMPQLCSGSSCSGSSSGSSASSSLLGCCGVRT